MTNPIAIAPKPAQPSATAGRLRVEPAPADFAVLIDAGDTPSSRAPHALGAIFPDPAAPAPSGLATELSGLLEKLAALAGKRDDKDKLAGSDIDELEALLAAIEALLDQGAPLPLPDSPELAALGLALPADADGPTAPLDALAGLAARLADGLREDAPDLAARLAGLARAIDTHSAALQTALADEQSTTIASVRHIESGTRLNPAAAIAAQSAETPEPAPARPASDKDTPPPDRSLTKDAQASGPEVRKAPPQANVASAAAAPSPAPTGPDAPDGLVTPAPQPQSPTVTPSAMRPEAALYQRPDPQINLPHIAAEIARHVQNGTSRFEIRLNPPELGRIDVRMEVDASGSVVARLAVERSETLDLLQRDQRTLERALAEAGLDSARTELEFSLRQQGDDARDEPEKSPWRTSVATKAGTEASTPSINADLDPYMRGYARLDAVNLWV